MTIEKDIKDIKNAFMAFIEVRIDEELDHTMEVANIPEHDRFTTRLDIQKKYEKVLKSLQGWDE